MYLIPPIAASTKTQQQQFWKIVYYSYNERTNELTLYILYYVYTPMQQASFYILVKLLLEVVSYRY